MSLALQDGCGVPGSGLRQLQEWEQPGRQVLAQAQVLVEPHPGV